jgi:hypothetical protein
MAGVAFGGEEGANVAIELHPFGSHRCETRQKPETQAKEPGRCECHGKKLLGSISLDFRCKGEGIGESSRFLLMMIQVGKTDMSRLDIRELDMRASPYDLTSHGYSPVPIETQEGRAQYEKCQREFAERARPLRKRLIDLCESLLA